MKIQGYFNNIKAARETAEKLKNSGFNNAAIDMNDDFYEGRNDRPRRYGSQIKNSLSGMVIHSEIFEQRRDRAPLYAANPMVSGMGTIGDIVNLNSKVIVEAGEDNADLAKKIIEEMGGGLDTPAQKL